ncbi:MAG: DUF6056 family protein [Anaerolineales bacterium]
MSQSPSEAASERWVGVGKGALLLLLSLPLLALIYLASFSRFLADDYCTHSTLVEQGLFGSQAYWYLNWSGRYSFTLLVNLTELLGSSFTPLLIALTVPLWLGLLTVSLRTVLRALSGASSWGLSLLLGSLILVATMNGTPDMYQSLLWQTGLVTYVVPLILGTAYLGWIASLLMRGTSEEIRRWEWAVSLVWAFVAGGFSETYVSMQIAGLLALSAASFVPRWQRNLSPIRGVVLAGLAGSLLSLLAIVGAPGNQVRRSLMPDPGNLLSIVGWSIRHAFAFVAKSIIGAPVTSLLAMALPLCAAVFLWSASTIAPPLQNRSARRASDIHLVIPAATFLLILASIIPSVFATSAYPAERSLITAQYALISSLVLWGFTLGYLGGSAIRRWAGARKVWLGAIVLALTLIGSLATTQRILGWLPDAREFSVAWGLRDASIREALDRGDTEMEIASLSHMAGLAEVGFDPDEWINICVADSYGLASVVAK